jgi:rod shape-determining protein MreC
VIRIKQFIPLISFFLLVLFILSLPVFSPQRSAFFDFLEVPLKIFSYPSQVFKSVFFAGLVKHENERLKRENAVLHYTLAQLLEMKNENIRLKELLKLQPVSAFNLVIASVIARDPDNWTSTLIIDKGKDARVREDCVVIGKEGLIGIVSDAGLTTSRVTLINDPNFSCAVELSRSRVQGLLSGSLFGGCRLRFLAKEDDVALNDMVITSGLNLGTSKSLFPRGIVIGKVRFIGEEFSGLGKYCVVEPVEKLGRLEEVLVIIH